MYFIADPLLEISNFILASHFIKDLSKTAFSRSLEQLKIKRSYQNWVLFLFIRKLLPVHEIFFSVLASVSVLIQQWRDRKEQSQGRSPWEVLC